MWVGADGDAEEQRTVRVPHQDYPEVGQARRWFESLHTLVHANSWGVPHRVFDDVKLSAYTPGSTAR